MAIEDFLQVPGLEKTLRLNRDCHKPFYAAFIDEVQDAKFLTTDLRKEIVARWQKITPLIPENNLRQQLLRYEQKYYAAIPKWEAPTLVAKITDQSMAMQEEIYEASPSIAPIVIRKAQAINDINKTIAAVNKLDSQTPTATFVIHTNIHEEDLIKDMNNIIDIEPQEEEEE